VAVSVERPLWYYDQNLSGLAHVLRAMDRASVGSIVYSSSAAVYGDVSDELVTEDAALEPVNPYGRSKLAGEWLLQDATRAHGVRAVALRYFNVAGAGVPELGDTVVANLVTIVLDRIARGLRPQVYGTDYPTDDGSCVRDYVHVVDLAEAHVATLDRLTAGDPVGDVFNVGRGEGVSVLEVLSVLGEVCGLDLTPELVARRPGDPARVVAAVDRIAQDVRWSARADLRAILDSAWTAWQSGPRAI
jgi:UDP-glucose 4-epimerase